MQYDKTSAESIYAFAKTLTGSSLGRVANIPPEVLNELNKGDLGSLLEKYFFEHRPPNDHNPDFAEAGLELKATGVLKDSKVPGGYKAKERLVLTMINFERLVDETWETSSLMFKCRLLLVLFYLYEKDKSVLNRTFLLDPMMLRELARAEEDLEQIRLDWEAIRQKVVDGKAHELSEGDTKYLGACTKAANSRIRTAQPNSDEDAKPRAFSLKQGYLTSLLAGDHEDFKSLREPLVFQGFAPDSSQEMAPQGFAPDNFQEMASQAFSLEQTTSDRFQPFIGCSESQLSEQLGWHKSGPNHKGFYSELAKRILLRGAGEPLELVKEGVTIKTVRLEQNGKPQESMSFPAFRYLELVNETWEESSFLDQIEGRFLFVIFRKDDSGTLRLQKSMYWTMPYADRQEARKVWSLTVSRVLAGNYSLPGSKDSTVAHVRPHARNKLDTNLTPQGTFEVKRSFWLNSKYIARIVS